jgi:hypothetical protein
MRRQTGLPPWSFSHDVAPETIDIRQYILRYIVAQDRDFNN